MFNYCGILFNAPTNAIPKTVQIANDATNPTNPIKILMNGLLYFFIIVNVATPVPAQIAPPKAPPITGMIAHN